VASSLLGVTGTAIGAVLASVVISVGTALYTRPIERTSQVLKETLPVRVDRMRLASDREGEGSVPTGATAVGRPGQRRSRRTAGPGAAQTRRKIWTAVALSSLATIALAFALLTGVEGITGEPVSSWTGHGGHSGTTLGQLFRPGGASSTQDSPGTNASHHDQPTGPVASTPAPTPPTVTVTVPTTPTPTSPALSNPAPSSGAPTSSSPTTPTATTPTPTSVTSTTPRKP
jgi:hypothetical protein